MIPFQYGCVVTGDHFCPRPELETQLVEHALSGQNLVIQGGLRMGKTSLLVHALANKRDIRLIYIDLYFIQTPFDFCTRVMRGIARASKELSFLRKALDFAMRLRPTLSFDPGDGSPVISVDARTADEPASVTVAMEALAKIAAEKKSCVVFDEFQSILALENSSQVLAEMRSVIQFQADTAFFFTGSIRHDMMCIFDHSDSPFYKSALPFAVEEIAAEPFTKFLQSRFLKGNRQVAPAVIRQILKFADGVPGDAQELCEALWITSKPSSEITEDNFATALSLIFSREMRGYETILQRLTPAQTKVLKAIAARNGVVRPAAKEFTSMVNLAPSTIQRALARLQTDNVVFQRKGEYRFANPFFREWLRRTS